MKFIKLVMGMTAVLIIAVGSWFVYHELFQSRIVNTIPETDENTTTSSKTVEVPEANFLVEQTPVTFTSNGNRLVGDLYMPQSSTTVPVAIYAHELGMNRDAGRLYAQFLAERGIATIIFDFAGGSPSSQSDGSVEEMTLSSEIADLESVILQARSIAGIDASRVHIIGASQGGLVAALLAAQYPTQVQSLTLLYPAFLIPEVIRQLAEVLGDRSLVTSLFGVYPIGPQYVSDLWNLDVYQVIGQYQGPVMMIQGSKDPLIDISYIKKAAEVYSKAQIHEIDGAGHSFTDEHFEEASRYLWENISTAK